jgi:murein biosynthesis integral membrane protein MurJ
MSTPAPPAGPTAADGGHWMGSAPGPYPAPDNDQADSAWPGEFPGPSGPAEDPDADADAGEPDGAAPASGGPATGPATGADSLVRSSGVMAIGTLASRVTGFLRTAVFGYALGTGTLADAYNNANTLPNTVYNLALGGILTSVVVPLLVAAAKRDSDRGEGYDQRIFTLVAIALGGITAAATLAAGPLVTLYAASVHGSEHSVMVVFAYFFIPQIFFYGMSSLAGAILNARGHFASPMWTPVVNNVVVIAVGALFMVTAGLNLNTGTISSGEVQLLGIGTTAGIIIQSAALLPSLRRVGFRWRPRFDFRRSELTEIRRMAGWMFGYIATTQVAFLITSRVANEAAERAHHVNGSGFTDYSYAWQLFQMPYAIIGISVITALLPRMSAHAADRQFGLVRDDFSTGVRLSAVIVAPAALVLAVLGPQLSEVLLGYGSTSFADAKVLGEVFAVFSLGLVPYMLFQLLLRVFYAMHDSRTPALIGVLTMAVNIAANLLALSVLPPSQVVAGLGAGFGAANLVGTLAAWAIVARRTGGLDGRRIGSTLLRMHLAAIPAVLFCLAWIVMVGVLIPAGTLSALVEVSVAGIGALLLYVMFARALGVAELNELTSSVTRRLRR